MNHERETNTNDPIALDAFVVTLLYFSVHKHHVVESKMSSQGKCELITQNY